MMYLTTPALSLVALDAASGAAFWSFNDSISGGGVNRGVTFFSHGAQKRLFFVKGGYLYSIDAMTGTPDSTFGIGGRVDLFEGLGRNVRHTWVTAATPGIIFQDKLILGSTLGEGPGPAAPGHIRAYDVYSGKLEWIFHTIPQPGEEAYDTWPSDAWTSIGGVNCWGGFTLDTERGIVYFGTGSATYDHYGGNRKGANLFSNCIMALDADTGKKVWHYQTVHHDIWDYDLPCAPNLVQVHKDGKLIDALAQPTKMGHLFVLDRENGEPIFPIEEIVVPQTTLPGEETWATQPFPIESLRYAGQTFDHENVTNVSQASATNIKDQLQEMVTGSIFTPPGLKPSVVFPQFNGGTDWGGAAYDPQHRRLIVNCSNEPEWISMVPNQIPEEISNYAYGNYLFQTFCTQCHSSAVAANPSLIALDVLRKTVAQRTDAQLIQVVTQGKGQMPAHQSLTQDEKGALISFLRDQGHDRNIITKNLKSSVPNEIPYVATGHNEFKDQDGFPANRPPWGMLTSINLDEGLIEWQVPLGTYPDLEAKGLPPTGTFNMGGPLVTAGGLIFIGASMDERFHVYDSNDGQLLWEYQLEAGGYASPSTFMVDGRQYVVIAAGGGGKPGTKAGDKYYCFSLPDATR
ncbi:MAG: PQQ-binding-like beta-propeller repeat protein [Saprospiraceae bacterium]|nr:PQQ-binding-like beta-propeller repeat protein [Saprospiraceae bacterium]